MHAQQFFKEASEICNKIDKSKIDNLATELELIRKNKGRLFVLGVGGSAGNASHAVNDFRKLCAIEAYAPTDNVSELTARTNDEGWGTIFDGWLKISNIKKNDALFILSVGGGNLEKNVSPGIVNAIDLAKQEGAKVLGVVGRDGGYAGKKGDCVIVVPTVNDQRITPHTEAFHAVVWHCLVSNPILQVKATKW
jgi:D-sedoheptulose 7-phosphate isomerase